MASYMAKHGKRRKRKLSLSLATLVTGAGVMLAGTLYAAAQSPREPVHLAPVHLTAPQLAPPQLPVQQPSAVRLYTVRSDDTLSQIAKDHCGDSRKWQQLAQANHIDGNQLSPGKVITLACLLDPFTDSHRLQLRHAPDLVRLLHGKEALGAASRDADRGRALPRPFRPCRPEYDHMKEEAGDYP